jgi:uncharacterized protein
MELKNVYDDFPALKIVFTGSSLLQMQKGRADLSRRAVMYLMPGLSFREYIQYETGKKFPQISLGDLMKKHVEIAIDVSQKIRPLAYFGPYLQSGYYPFYLEDKTTFHQKLTEALHAVIEIDIPQYENVQISGIQSMKKLLFLISQSSPFKPNMNSISQRLGISVNTLKIYLQYFEQAGLISMLRVKENSLNSLAKPEKIYLHNTSLMYNLGGNTTDKGSLRETFFLSQVSSKHNVYASETADFLVDGKYTFEVGGKNKDKKQIKNKAQSFLVKDDIEIGSDNTIPLWMFGLLY